jgi:hypothetical protein
MSLNTGNADLLGLDIAATTVDTNSRCAISPPFAEPLEEVRTGAGKPTSFMATNVVAEVGGEVRAFGQWKVE